MADPTKDNADIGTSSAEIVGANTLRNGVLLFNEGSEDVWLGFGEDAEANKGAKVPAGGSITLLYNGEPSGAYNQFIKAINGIAASGTNTVAYQEV